MAFSHQSAQAHQSSLSTTRLPSIRDLNFAYDPPSQLPPDPASSPSGPIQQSEHRGPAPNQPQRHDWNRQVPPPPQSSSMQLHRSHLPPAVANNHDHPRHEPPFGQPGGNLPLSSQMPPPPPRDSESTQKRPRTNAPTVGVSPRSSSHVSRALRLPLLPLFPTKGTTALTFTVSYTSLSSIYARMPTLSLRRIFHNTRLRRPISFHHLTNRHSTTQHSTLHLLVIPTIPILLRGALHLPDILINHPIRLNTPLYRLPQLSTGSNILQSRPSPPPPMDLRLPTQSL
jgi:hypothetical protein